MAAEVMDMTTNCCRRCKGRSHTYRLPDGTAIDAVVQVESKCPHDAGRMIRVSLGASAALVRMNERNLKAFLARLEHEKKRHLRRAVRADAKAARKRAMIEAEGEEFRRVG
jgi:hypothetical protein